MSAPLSFPRGRIRVVLLEGIHESAVEQLQSRGYTRIERYGTALDGDELRRAIADAHLVGIRSRTQLSGEAIEAAERLVAIGCFCIGTNQVDIDAAAHRGVPVFNAPHSNTRSVAELVIGLTVMLMRDVFAKSRAVHEGRWPKSAKGSRELRGKTMGIIGYGHIGSQVSILAEALGMVPFDPWPFHAEFVPTHPQWHCERPAGENGSPDLLREILYRNPSSPA